MNLWFYWGVNIVVSNLYNICNMLVINFGWRFVVLSRHISQAQKCLEITINLQSKLITKILQILYKFETTMLTPK